MLSVLADVGGLMAEGIEYTWLSNRDRLRLLASKLHIIKQRKVSDGSLVVRAPTYLNLTTKGGQNLGEIVS